MTERSFTEEELREQRGHVSAPVRAVRSVQSFAESRLVLSLAIAGGFALLHIDLQYALGAFLLVNGAKLIQVVQKWGK